MKKSNYPLFESNLIEDALNALNKELLKNSDIFLMSKPTKHTAVQQSKIVNDFLDQYNKNCGKHLTFNALFHMLNITHDNIDYKYVIDTESKKDTPFYKLINKAYTRHLNQNIFLKLTKDENNELKTIDFNHNYSTINTLIYMPDSCKLNNQHIYKEYKNNEEKFWKLMTDCVVMNKTERSLHKLSFDIYELSDALYKIESKHFLNILVKSMLTGQDYLQPEKDLLMMTCDIDIDNYQYKKILLGINEPKNNDKKPKINI